MKKLLPLLAAGFVFVLAVVLMGVTRQKTTAIVVASRALPTGHTLKATDLTLADLPEASVPADAVTEANLATLVGGTLRTDRSPGDVITSQHLGGQSIALQPNERAVALEVTDAAGLAGLLKPGDLVGVTAVLNLGNAGTYAKVIAEDLRVLYVSPEYSALDPAVYEQAQNPDAAQSGSAYQNAQVPDRKKTGVVVLAVSIDAQAIAYDFAIYGVESPARVVNVMDLLPALDHAREVELSLFIQPSKAEPFTTSGVFLPDLIITPGPSPTPTQSVSGSVPTLTPPLPVATSTPVLQKETTP